MSKNIWTRAQLLLAFNLYCKLPFGQYDQRNPMVIELAQAIDRTPGAVAMKLSNFASLDPYHQQRGIKGLSNVSRADRAIWDEFHHDWNNVRLESETLVAEIKQDMPDALVAADSAIGAWATQPTEVERSVKTRLGQRFFRHTVLTSYQSRCCVCGIPIPDLLIASHIILWGKREDTRLNPHNGLCLCALHDKAFDTGLITVDSAYCVQVSQVVYQYLPDKSLQHNLAAYAGSAIPLPDKFIPDKDFLAYHRKEVFRKA